MDDADAKTQLASFGEMADDDIPLAEAALLLGSLEHRGIDLDPYRSHLATLAAEVGKATQSSTSVDQQAAALRSVICETYGYHGDAETYDDTRNANLVDVIDRRCGLPVALGILFIHAVRGYGGTIDGLSFPAHFVVRIAGRGQRAILDPFHEGRMLYAGDLRERLKGLQGVDAEITPDHYVPVGNRDILIRPQNNIKIRAIGEGDLKRGLRVLEGMTLIAPDRPELWWETAVLQCRLGRLVTAVSTLETFLAGAGADRRHDEIEGLLAEAPLCHELTSAPLSSPASVGILDAWAMERIPADSSTPCFI